MKLSKLKKRSVINTYNGNFLGYVVDIEIVLPEGNVNAFIVKPNFFKRIIFFFNTNNKYIVSWNNIVSIGKDVILVNIIDN